MLKKAKTTARKSAKSKSARKALPVRKAGAGTRGRSSKFSGKKLFPTAEVKKANPRRAGVLGFKSLEIIRKKPGLTYEEFIAQGGRQRDLNWDAERNRVDAR